MFSKTIIKQSIRNNWKIWLTITLSTTLFLVLNIFLFDLKGSEQSTNGPQMNNVIEVLDLMFYGVLGIILPMIYSIFVGNKLVASEVDKGILAGVIVKSPHTEFMSSIALTRLFFFIRSSKISSCKLFSLTSAKTDSDSVCTGFNWEQNSKSLTICL